MAVVYEEDVAAGVTETQIQQYVDKGYLIIDTEIPGETLDGVIGDFADFWQGGPRGPSYRGKISSTARPSSGSCF